MKIPVLIILIFFSICLEFHGHGIGEAELTEAERLALESEIKALEQRRQENSKVFREKYKAEIDDPSIGGIARAVLKYNSTPPDKADISEIDFLLREYPKTALFIASKIRVDDKSKDLLLGLAKVNFYGRSTAIRRLGLTLYERSDVKDMILGVMYDKANDYDLRVTASRVVIAAANDPASIKSLCKFMLENERNENSTIKFISAYYPSKMDLILKELKFLKRD